MPYYGNRISENIAIRQPEGYLICQNVPVARTGMQEYAPQELGREGNEMIQVYREESEVFSPATIASFEGMPVTNDHPGSDVDANNIRVYQRGHVQNVRRGQGDQSDLLLADLVITHPDLIEAIQNGKREVSCGYQCEYQEVNGKFYQRAIRGNHVAVVDQGRAGPRVAIKDQRPAQGKERSTSMSPKPNSAGGILGKIFKAFAQDAEPEELDAAGKLLYGTNDTSGEPIKAKDAEPTPPTVTPPQQQPAQQNPPQKDEDPMTVLTQAVTALVAKVDALAAKVEGGAAKVDEDPLAQLEKEVTGESPAAPEGNLIDPKKLTDEEPAEEEKKPEEEKPTQDKATIKAAIDAIKPIIAKLPEKDRRAASDAMAKQLRSVYGMNTTPATKDNAYLAVKTAVAKGKDGKPATMDDRDLGAKIMQQRNANMRTQATQPVK